MIKTQIRRRFADTLYGLPLEVVDWFHNKGIEFHLTCRSLSGDDQIGYNHFSITVPHADDLIMITILFPEISVKDPESSIY